MRKRYFLALLSLLLTLSTVPFARLQAQSTTTLTLAVSEFMKDLFTPELIGQFESAHPGVTVQVVSASQPYAPAANGIENYLDSVEKYVSAGDVVYISGDYISPAATRAGYFLDLTPLVSADKTLNADDFYASIVSAFNWDHQTWGLPIAASAFVLSYDPAAFDKAGLTYPDAKWTVDDLENAVRKLAQKDANGKVTIPGIAVSDGAELRALLSALAGTMLYDDNSVPDSPQFAKPGVEKAVDTWAKLKSEGLVGGTPNEAPLSVAPIFTLNFPGTKAKHIGALLPGGTAGLDVEGFAVSAGTPYPELAYALVSFLTTRYELGARFAGAPARKSLSNTSNAPEGGNVIRINGSPEVTALTNDALLKGFSLTGTRYADYLVLAAQKVQSGNLVGHAALQLLENQAVKDQQAAIARKGKKPIVLATPVPVVVQAGKATLNFGLNLNIRPVPNQDLWDKLAQEFAVSDPQIGKVNLAIQNGSVADESSTQDCFYLPFNGVPSAKLSSLLNLDPLIASDTTFDKNDVVGNLWSQLQRDGKTWALPIIIQPSLLKYNADLLSKAGIKPPTKGWTIDAFVDALKILKPMSSGAPFINISPGGTYLLMLMAAYGGIPLDYRTDPPTSNLTDPDTVQAIRQVLDLAKAGYLKYSALGSVGGVFMFGAIPDAPITSAELNGFKIPAQEAYKTTLYPTGSKYNAISYSVGTAYISATSQYPDACYRWISLIARHPELFSAMPARRSLINDTTIAAAQGAEMTAAYNAIDTLLKDPNTLSFPLLFDGGRSQIGFLIQHWIYEAFDAYVLDGKDLEIALKDAQTYIQGFTDCMATIPAYDPSDAQAAQQYLKAGLECVVKVDPRLKSFAGGIK